MLFPIEAPADGLVPAAQELFPFFGLHFRLERHVAVPQALKLLAVFPDADGKPRKIRRAKRRRLADNRPAHGLCKHVRLELHQKAVAARPAVDSQLRERHARVLFHRVDQIIRLIRDRLLRGSYNMLGLCPTREADHRASCVHVPMRRAEARERRHEIHAACVRHLGRKIFRVPSLPDEPQLVAQPLDDCTADKNRALERILHAPAEADRDRGNKPVHAFHRRLACVHEQKAACAVGVFRIAGCKAALTEQRRLLVACNARDRHLHALNVARAVDLGGIAHRRQHRGRNSELPQKPFVPAEVVDIIEHRARRVRVVGDMYLPVRELPDEPGVDRAEQKFSTLGLFLRAGDVV